MSIKIDNVSLQFGNFYALKKISLELSDNKIFGLLGRNGAGKTSLLSLIASFREPTSGSISINGETPFENEKIMEQVLFMYSKNYGEETDNIKKMLDSVQSYRPNFDRKYAEYLVDKFKLDRKKPIKKFSKGMQSALNVTIGLAARAPITILDEVYLGMDAPSRDFFYKELLKEQENHPRIFILSTHLVSEMDYLFDEVILLNEGEIMLHEEYDSFVSKGVIITGEASIVDSFVQGKNRLNEQVLGRTKSVAIYGELHEEERKLALNQDLEIAPISLQDLFIHLTKEED